MTISTSCVYLNIFCVSFTISILKVQWSKRS